LRTPDQLAGVWEGMRIAVGRGQQAFVVCPRIDPDEAGDDIPSAIATERDLRMGELRGLRLGLMHGRMAAKERDDVMRRFAARDLEIRGAGEFLGERQSGAPELRVVDLADVDPRLVEETAGEADRILRVDPELGRSEHELLARAVEQLWRRYALA